MIDFVCALRRGGCYDLAYVRRLRAGLRDRSGVDHRLTCVTDLITEGRFEEDGVAFVPLAHDSPGWWCKPAVFRTPGPAVYLDLDTVVCGPLVHIAEATASLGGDQLMMLRDFYTGGWASGVMAWSGGMNALWDRFVADRERGHFLPGTTTRLRIGSRTFKGDQNWIEYAAEELGLRLVPVQSTQPGVLSYKVNLVDSDVSPKGVSLACFHGKPKPHELANGHWLKTLWWGTT